MLSQSAIVKARPELSCSEHDRASTTFTRPHLAHSSSQLASQPSYSFPPSRNASRHELGDRSLGGSDGARRRRDASGCAAYCVPLRGPIRHRRCLYGRRVDAPVHTSACVDSGGGRRDEVLTWRFGRAQWIPFGSKCRHTLALLYQSGGSSSRSRACARCMLVRPRCWGKSQALELRRIPSTGLPVAIAFSIPALSIYLTAYEGAFLPRAARGDLSHELHAPGSKRYLAHHLLPKDRKPTLLQQVPIFILAGGAAESESSAVNLTRHNRLTPLLSSVASGAFWTPLDVWPGCSNHARTIAQPRFPRS